MATLPIYLETTLPCLVYPMDNEHEPTVRGLGGKATVGRSLASVNYTAESDAEIAALEAFLNTECNYGLDPFLIPIPFFGEAVTVATPAILVQLRGGVKAAKPKFTMWTGSLSLEVLGKIDYTIEAGGDFTLHATGDFTFDVDGNLVSTGLTTINSYREIFY